MKKLKFLGIGSAFNPVLDNTSAFFTYNENFYLIDCGESVFRKIWNLKEMLDSKEIFILITHFHCDHVGSLGSLVSYLYLKKGKIPYIIHPTKKIISYLEMVGVEKKFYKYRNKLPEISKVKNREIEVKHVNDMTCYGYEIIFPDETVYYSGDAVEIPEEIFQKYFSGEITEIYQDTCSYIDKNPTHGNIFYLEKIFPSDKRNRVYCMHLDNDFRDTIEKKGFGKIEYID
ncbi:MBL fold metallo-hydrolase [Leptotrichia sp. OH3620_COT-345]|uniref:MBL fold metallo-hydrolase n=1 Tax=Leptotrichia sp. OH3620_COT-345 TaxID=2491048 RepID=UPI0013150CB6|nr:MBL fold metallo-hydrolase [Leptotrichia sp. OH3620_COT-345]